MLKAKLFVSIHIFKAMLQVKNSFKKRYITIKVKKVLKPIILLSYAVSKQCQYFAVKLIIEGWI